MTIGEILDKLEKAPPDAYVRFDFGGIYPTVVDSWRGIYAEAALGFTDGQYGQPFMDVKMFQKELNNAIDGRTFQGWKGGEYSYTRDTPLHVDNRGNCSNTEIERIEIDEFTVRLITVYEP